MSMMDEVKQKFEVWRGNHPIYQHLQYGNARDNYSLALLREGFEAALPVFEESKEAQPDSVEDSETEFPTERENGMDVLKFICVAIIGIGLITTRILRHREKWSKKPSKE